jgi:hypothetical protein
VVSTPATLVVSVERSIEHASTVSPVRVVLSTNPPSPGPSQVPKHMSAYGYAMFPFLKLGLNANKQDLDHSPSSTNQGSESGTISSLRLPVLNDRRPRRQSKEKSDVFVFSTSSNPRNRAMFGTRMKHIQLRTLLMQCTMIQSTIRELQRKPWVVKKTDTVRLHYEKIRSLAYKALQLAQALENPSLQARPEYWAGRGCGGTRDYQAAEAHFEDAIRLNKFREHEFNSVPQEGLRPMEEQDVHFLLESCRARHQNWKERNDKIVKFAERESTETQKPLQTCLDETPLISPPWMPDHDRITELDRRRFECVKPPSKVSQPWVDKKHAQELQNEVQAQMREDRRDMRASTIITFTREELEYIKHGNATRYRRQRNVDEVATIRSRSTLSESILQQLPQSETPPKALSTPEHDVRDETEKSPYFNPKPPPTDNFQERREVSLRIDTRSIRTQPQIGNATHATSLVSGSDDPEAKSTNPTNSASTKPPPLVASPLPFRRNTSSSSLSPVAESESERLFTSSAEENEHKADNHEENNHNEENKEKDKEEDTEEDKGEDEKPRSAPIDKIPPWFLQGEQTRDKRNHHPSLPSTPLLRTKSDTSWMKGKGFEDLGSSSKEGMAKINWVQASSPLKSSVSCASSPSRVSMH